MKVEFGEYTETGRVLKMECRWCGARDSNHGKHPKWDRGYLAAFARQHEQCEEAVEEIVREMMRAVQPGERERVLTNLVRGL